MSVATGFDFVIVARCKGCSQVVAAAAGRDAESVECQMTNDAFEAEWKARGDEVFRIRPAFPVTLEGCLCGFVSKWREVQQVHHGRMRAKGFHDSERNEGEIIALIHSELSEALEALRVGNPPDDKIPEYRGVEAELADVVLRVMDYAELRGYRVAEALLAKMVRNRSREHRHGGKAF